MVFTGGSSKGSMCFPCPRHTMGVNGQCEECGAGNTSSRAGERDEMLQCSVRCPAGKARALGVEDCTLCARGRVAPADGSASCTACVQGRYGPAEGQTECGRLGWHINTRLFY